ncbi:hypothetical protein J1605_001501 [Eschrichtius robustus]|uniref:ENTH domain-containing protein n=1 Tax=Eschrichtius robustus TaxID=9764 RepID=A0AB34I375_ESCRO|nr:hypothetical protein J1605_001501 [Eschrichtius robustus]
MSGQSLTDRITAAQHSVTGSAVSKTVCKATTHEIMGPKKKHLDSASSLPASSPARRVLCSSELCSFCFHHTCLHGFRSLSKNP